MPSRREVGRVLGLLGLGSAAALAGCGLRLEDDAPTIPFVPRRTIPDEALLIAARRRADALARLAAQVPGAAEAAARHTRQVDVLDAILHAGGVPADLVVPTTSATASGSRASSSAVTTAPAPVTPADLGAREAALPADGLTSGTTQRTLLASIAAHDSATAAALGVPVAWPAGDPLPAPAADSLLGSTRAAAYGIEVAAARTPAGARAELLQALAELRGREAALAALSTTPAPAGYALPSGLSPQALVTHVLGVLVDQGLAPLTHVPAGSRAVVEVIRLLADAVALAARHGVPPTPFPGLRE